MADSETLIAQARARCQPCSEVGERLLDLYLDNLLLDASPRTELWERQLVYALMRLVETVDFPTVSVERLEAAKSEHNGTRNGARIMRIAINRLVCLLQTRGELPSTKDLYFARAIERELDGAPEHARTVLRRWLGRRHQTVGWEHLHREARRLGKLEQILLEDPDIDHERALERLRRAVVRATVDCGCHPGARAATPLECRTCGATPETHRVVYRPGERSQSQFIREAEAYLSFRTRALPQREYR